MPDYFKDAFYTYCPHRPDYDNDEQCVHYPHHSKSPHVKGTPAEPPDRPPGIKPPRYRPSGGSGSSGSGGRPPFRPLRPYRGGPSRGPLPPVPPVEALGSQSKHWGRILSFGHLGTSALAGIAVGSIGSWQMADAFRIERPGVRYHIPLRGANVQHGVS